MIAAELSTSSPDFGLLEPTVTAALRELQAAGVTDLPGVVLADAGYWPTTRWTDCALSTACTC